MIKIDRDRLLLILIIKKNAWLNSAEMVLSFIFEIKSSLSTSIFISSNISEILNTKFHVLRTQTCTNLKSIKFASFLLSKSESVKFSLIESMICLFTDSSVKKYFSLLNKLLFTDSSVKKIFFTVKSVNFH